MSLLMFLFCHVRIAARSDLYHGLRFGERFCTLFLLEAGSRKKSLLLLSTHDHERTQNIRNHNKHAPKLIAVNSGSSGSARGENVFHPTIADVIYGTTPYGKKYYALRIQRIFVQIVYVCRHINRFGTHNKVLMGHTEGIKNNLR